jgi:hypothetical protein
MAAGGIMRAGKLVLTDQDANNDTFDRLRVSVPSVVYEWGHAVDKSAWVVSEVLVGGAPASTLDDRGFCALRLPVASTVAGARIFRQSRMYVRFHPGAPRLFVFSVAFPTAGTATGAVCRAGMFDNGPDKTQGNGAGVGGGHFFQVDAAGVVGVVERSTRTGVQIDTVVPRSQWANNALAAVDFTKTAVLWIDACWSGSGVVRMGAVVGGRMVTAHTFETAADVPSMRTLTLPVRYEVERTATGGGADAELRAMSASVMVENTQLYFPIRYSIGLSSTTGGSFAGKTMPTAQGSSIVLLSVRVAPWNCRAMVSTAAMAIYTSDASNLEYRLLLNATLVGSSWSDYLGTGIEYDTAATSASGGICVVGGMSSGAERVDNTRTDHVRARVTSNYAGVPDTMSLVAYNIAAASTKTFQVYGFLQVLMDRE